jgi:HD-GYP domain-containing protein (c-di-GMP phosphodiesterase class II)
MSVAAAKRELRRCAGTQFDERVVEVFLGLVADGKQAALVA